MCGVNIKQIKEKSRECHNHKPQPFPDTKRKRKRIRQRAALKGQRGGRKAQEGRSAPLYRLTGALKWLVVLTSDHEIPDSNPAKGRIQLMSSIGPPYTTLMTVWCFIAQSLSLSPFPSRYDFPMDGQLCG